MNQQNPFFWIVAIGGLIVLVLTGWLNANLNWNVVRDEPIIDVRNRN